jgi:ABC-2 type transport system permease protein
MSAAEVAAVGVAPAPRRLVSTRFFRSELRLIYGRRRNWVGLATLSAVPIVIAVSTKLSGGDDPTQFFNQITNNGLFVALAALMVELPLFLPIAVAAISGDAIAGEANVGTLRYLLAVPVHRTRLLVVKYLAIAVFAFSVAFLVGAVGLAAGLALFGGGDVTLLSGTQVGMGEGLLRLLGVCVYIGVCLCALGAVGLFVSTLTEQPMGAAIAVIMFAIANFVLDAIPQIGWLHPYLLTHNWMAFGELLRDPISFTAIRPGLGSAAAYIVIFWSAAWARFGARDITS